MKHLKPFNENSQDTRTHIMGIINWKIVNYMKDIITRYKDDGQSVSINVECNMLTVYTYDDGKEITNPFEYTMGRLYLGMKNTNLTYILNGISPVEEHFKLLFKLRKRFPGVAFK